MLGSTLLPKFADPVRSNAFEEAALDPHFYLDYTDFPRLSNQHGQNPVPRHSCWHPEALLPVEGANVGKAVVPAKTLVRFMDLPSEVRSTIWDYYLVGETHVPMMPVGAARNVFRYGEDEVSLSWYRSHSYQAHPPFLPAVSRMSKAIYAETVQAFLRSTTLTCSSIGDNRNLDAFLAAVPRGYESVCKLYFNYFGRMPATAMQNMDLELAVRCTGLRETKFMMHNAVLANTSAGAAWAYYNFERLLGCHRIGRVNIRTMGFYDTTLALIIARELASLIKRAFLALGKTVLVQVDGVAQGC